MSKMLAKAFSLCAILNFMVFWLLSACIGGDAWNGKVEAGHYYLAQNARYTEVSQPEWLFIKYYTIGTFVAFAAAILVSGLADRATHSPSRRSA